MIKPDEFTIKDYLRVPYSCSCGREHRTDLKEVEISENAIEVVPSLIKKYGYKKVFLVSDCNTFKVAGEQVLQTLKAQAIPVVSFIFKDKELIPDESAIGKMLVAFESDCDIIVAVGAGTINDLCKFVSYKLNLEYFIVATAPSMDGFASSVAAMITNNMKTTYEAHVPLAIIGDINILKEAPMNMITAGVGDILGKYTCLMDWKMAHIVNDEYYCETIVEMVHASIKSVIENMEKVNQRDSKAIKNIMEALVLSGIAMSFVGNSRPASGSEHHISHYWEMMFMFQNRAPVLHGTKVGIGTVAVLQLYEMLKEENVNFSNAREKARRFSWDNWKQNMIRTYGIASEGVIALEEKVHKNDPECVEKRIDIMETKWNQIICSISKDLPASQTVKGMLEKIDASVNPQQEGIDSDMLVDSIIVAKEVRNRYGLLQILYDLGLLEEMAYRLKEYFEYQ